MHIYIYTHMWGRHPVGPYATSHTSDMSAIMTERAIPARLYPRSKRAASGVDEPEQPGDKWATGTTHYLDQKLQHGINGVLHYQQPQSEMISATDVGPGYFRNAHPK